MTWDKETVLHHLVDSLDVCDNEYAKEGILEAAIYISMLENPPTPPAETKQERFTRLVEQYTPAFLPLCEPLHNSVNPVFNAIQLAKEVIKQTKEDV